MKKTTSERPSQNLHICGNEPTNVKFTWPVEAVLDVSQGLGAHQGDTVLLTVVEGGDRAELGVQLAELVTLSPNMGKTCCVPRCRTGYRSEQPVEGGGDIVFAPWPISQLPME